MVSISYSLASLHEASKFIFENNTSIDKWPNKPNSAYDVMNQIRDLVKRGAIENANLIQREKQLSVKLDSDWVSYTGTGGYFVIYDLESGEDEEDVVIGATILVDPAVSHPHPGYVTEVIDDGQ